MKIVSMVDGHIDGCDTCIICGRDVPEGRQVCPNCEKDIDKNIKYCPECGQKLEVKQYEV